MLNIHIDFETYSECDLKKCGAWEYSCHPSTEVLCMAYATDLPRAALWLPGESPPRWAESIVINHKNIKLHAWNSFFEYCIWHNTLKWPRVPIEKWDNTQAHAMALSLPRSLGDCGGALGFKRDRVKDNRGKRLIQMLCKPYRGKRITDKKLLKELYEYCKQDVIAERHIASKLKPISAYERKVWELDQQMNIKGLPIDTDNINHAIAIYEEEKARLIKQLKAITHLENPNSRQQFFEWLQDKGIEIDDVQASTLKALKNLTGEVQEAVNYRLQLAKTPIAKYEAILKRTSKDNRLRGFQLYHGASTGRFSSTGVNFQNLPRPVIEDIDACIDDFKHENPNTIKSYGGNVMDALSSCIRGMMKAPEGEQFYIADYAAIEARVLAWLAGQEDVLEVFNTHGKIYEKAASGIYNAPLNTITKYQRTVGKVAVLALGYQGGVAAFQKMAEIYQVSLPNDVAHSVINNWREQNTEIVRYWHRCQKAAIKAILNPSTDQVVNQVTFRYFNDFLFCKLPSGRLIAWHKPQVVDDQLGRQQIFFMGRDTQTGAWQKQSTYGGKIVENITQGVARDIMVNAMLTLDEAEYIIPLTVHDEIVVEVAKADRLRTLEHFTDIMNQKPKWADGLPIKAEAITCQRYQK